MVAYFKQLGITALELLPVAQLPASRAPAAYGTDQLWGCNPMAMFALCIPHGPVRETALDEFRDAVKARCIAGIEVILDIVVNHSAGWIWTVEKPSLRGIDNRSYYYWIRTMAIVSQLDGVRQHARFNHPGVVNVCAIAETRVDGFRFIWRLSWGARRRFAVMRQAFAAIKACLCKLSTVKLIAEPGTLARRLSGREFSATVCRVERDHFRDAACRFWLPQPDDREFALSLAASSDVSERTAARPAPVNLLTAHDGFTLRDRVWFHQKHNEANGRKIATHQQQLQRQSW